MVKPFLSAYVFTRLASGAQARVGEISADGPVGTFRYDESWLKQPDAYPLDPENLPLGPATYRTSHRKGVFGVFTDAGPDDWGTRILLMHHNSAPKNEVERLLRTSGGGVGVLEFSLSRTASRPPSPVPDVSLLDELLLVTQKVSARERLTEEQLALIEPGSSMGGARPKVVVREGAKTWLVKFSRAGDAVDLPRLEYATMRLMQTAGFHVPEVRLHELGSGQAAFMIRRFDRLPSRPVHFISANSLFHLERLRTVRDSRHNPFSYINLARLLRHHASAPEKACRELFRRMVFNILIGNTDDHARNHGLIYDIRAQTWQLAPAYDVLTTIGGERGRQALGVGVNGGESTETNALSYSKLFMLNDTTAKKLVAETKTLVETLPDALREAGLAPADRDLVQTFLNV
ncbi:type II toxin-antitoxin system HipA family toxin [Marinimicrobium locisalis]|uniref:type II toxin-antitoxin system HipA family toxin n=1 Tax=Marinimicrobium locisalis TaxID=546022 RepID=UPI003221ABE4